MVRDGFDDLIIIILFKIGNFDILNIGRCAPNQSWINPAERCMSLLNIASQGLDLQRDHAGLFESTISSCRTMKALRNKANQQIGFKKAFKASIEHSRWLVESSFSGLEFQGK